MVAACTATCTFLGNRILPLQQICNVLKVTVQDMMLRHGDARAMVQDAAGAYVPWCRGFAMRCLLPATPCTAGVGPASPAKTIATAAEETPTAAVPTRAVELVPFASAPSTSAAAPVPAAPAPQQVVVSQKGGESGGAAKVTAAGAAMLGTLGSKMNAAMSKYSDLPTGKRTAAPGGPSKVVVEAGERGPAGGARLDRIFAALDAQAKAVPVDAADGGAQRRVVEVSRGRCVSWQCVVCFHVSCSVAWQSCLLQRACPSWWSSCLGVGPREQPPVWSEKFVSSPACP